MAGRGRLRDALAVCVALTAIACSEQRHTVGVYEIDVAGSGASGHPMNGQSGAGGGGGGRPPPTDDGSTGFVDASIPDAAPQCAMSVRDTIRKRLDLYFLIDTNFFASDNGYWPKLVQGVEEYSRREEAAGTGLGLRVIEPPQPQLVPFGAQDPACDFHTYARVSAVIGPDPLPTNADEIADALSNVTISLSTPLNPALAGGIELARSRSESYPEREQAVVLISDAFFDFTCGSSVDDLVQTAAAGLSAHGIRSFMLELITPVPILEAVRLLPTLPVPTVIPLRPVAVAGGTDRAYQLNMKDDSASDLADSLLAIQHAAEPCDYLMPADKDWESVLLAVDIGMGLPGPVRRLNNLDECTGGDGAYLDTSTGMSWVRACPATCAAIKQTARAPLWVVDCDPVTVGE